MESTSQEKLFIHGGLYAPSNPLVAQAGGSSQGGELLDEAQIPRWVKEFETP